MSVSNVMSNKLLPLTSDDGWGWPGPLGAGPAGVTSFCSAAARPAVRAAVSPDNCSQDCSEGCSSGQAGPGISGPSPIDKLRVRPRGGGEGGPKYKDILLPATSGTGYWQKLLEVKRNFTKFLTMTNYPFDYLCSTKYE